MFEKDYYNNEVLSLIKTEIQLKLGDNFRVEIDEIIEYTTKNNKFGSDIFQIVVKTSNHEGVFFVGYLIDDSEFIDEIEKTKRLGDDFPFPILLFDRNDKSVIFYKNVKEDITCNVSKNCDFNLFLDIIGNNISLNDDKEFIKKVFEELEVLKLQTYERSSQNFELKKEIKLLKSKVETLEKEVEKRDKNIANCRKTILSHEQVIKNYEEYCKNLVIGDLKLIFHKNNIVELIKQIDLPKEEISYDEIYRGNEKIYRKISTIKNHFYKYFFTLFKDSLYTRVEIYDFYYLGDNEISRDVCTKILFFKFENSINQFKIDENIEPFLNDFVWVYIEELG